MYVCPQSAVLSLCSVLIFIPHQMKTNTAPRHECQRDIRPCVCAYIVYQKYLDRKIVNRVSFFYTCPHVSSMNNNWIFMWSEMTDGHMLSSECIFRFDRTSHLSPFADRQMENIINVKMRGITSPSEGPDRLRSLMDKLLLSNWKDFFPCTLRKQEPESFHWCRACNLVKKWKLIYVLYLTA